MEILSILILLTLAVIVSLFPSVVASHRGHKNLLAITICNFIGLFTGIFWLVALVWCFSDNVRENN